MKTTEGVGEKDTYVYVLNCASPTLTALLPMKNFCKTNFFTRHLVAININKIYKTDQSRISLQKFNTILNIFTFMLVEY